MLMKVSTEHAMPNLPTPDILTIKAQATLEEDYAAFCN
jgi:hypothetical protein